MKTYHLNTFYKDFNDSISYFYKQEKNTVNGCPRYRVWIMDPESNRVNETILKGYEPIETLLKYHLDKEYRNSLLERIRIALNKFSEREYGDEPYKSVDDMPDSLPLAYTTAGDDEEHELQVWFSFATYELVEELDGVIKQCEKYTLEEFADMMESVSFDDLTRDLYSYIDDEEDGAQ